MKLAEQRIAEGILFTDQYQLTMAQLYYKMGLHERPAQFDHFFRSYPHYGDHQAGYCINAGMEWLLDWMQEARFRDEELEFLRHQKGSTGTPIFSEDFLQWLKKHGTFESITIDAIPEGRVVHPNVPLTVVCGSLAMAQILETSLLNQLNYQTLIATKAARIHQAGHGQPLLDFGLRRGQERGANAGTRAAMIGGVDFTSNVGLSHILGYQPRGTHAHSMVQVFMALGEGELEAFRAYAEIYPDDCLLLVDTVDTLESGIPNAIKVFEELRGKGHKPVGIRLDSGDLAYLSIRAAEMLNRAGFPDTKIVLSNQIDELVLWQIVTQIEEEAHFYGIDPNHLIGRMIFGVGTRLITSSGASALGGVYKLVAVKNGDTWIPAIKISESAEKVLNPGQKGAWRLYDTRGYAIADLLTLVEEDPRPMERIVLHHPAEPHVQRSLERSTLSEIEPLYERAWDEGRIVNEQPSIEAMRERRRRDLERLYSGVRRIMYPHIYHVSLSSNLWNLKQTLIQTALSGEASG